MELGKHISILYRLGRAFMEQEMNDVSIGSGQYAFLFYLGNNDGVNQEDINKALSVDKATTTRAIQKLESLGYVLRKKDPLDGRVNRVFLTPEGYKMREELLVLSSVWESCLLEGLTTDEIIALETLIKKITTNAIKRRSNVT